MQANKPLSEQGERFADGSAPRGVDVSSGLSSEEARRRLVEHGENAIHEERISPLRRLLVFFWGPIPWMIEIAAILSASVQRWEDFSIIVLMLLLNAGVGFWKEFKADNAIQALKGRLAPVARVLRDGNWQELPSKLLVPGDVVFLRLGNIVPADATLGLDGALSLDESALTGESLPVDKQAGDTAYSGAVVRKGEMRALVTATGMNTFFGKTARLVQQADSNSHFQQAVMKIGNFLILTTVGLVALILVVALFRGDQWKDTLLFALILTVAAIPVALPAVLSVTLAVGAAALARMQAIVSRLVSIEELAGMDILCSDKTGTLTKNQISLGEPITIAAHDRDELLLAAALACERESPDVIDAAILGAVEPSAVALDEYKVPHFEPFDPVRKRVEAQLIRGKQQLRMAKGAPQSILELVGGDAELQAQVRGHAEELAAKGYRTLGVASANGEEPWRYLGLLSLFDPPRDDAAQTLARASEMGLSVRMVTGDHTAIARETARKLELGMNIVTAREVFGSEAGDADIARIDAADGFAEVFPEHKFKIVRALQAAGHIVGMTGDGVNDAPALRQADIGIAVSGATDAARAAADVVLTAPGLSVITRAVEEGRRIFERMTSYATFRIAETIRVLVFMTLSILVFNFYPVTAVMIVLLAILNDFPIMAIAYDNVPVAAQPVRWDMQRVLILASVLGLLGVVSTFVLFWIAERMLELPRPTIQTIIFLKLLVAGHLTIYLTRKSGWFWTRPWPAWRLFWTAELTQVVGTLGAVYGWFVEPIGWRYALLVWVYSLLSEFVLIGSLKVWVEKLLHKGTGAHARHLQRVHASLQARVSD